MLCTSASWRAALNWAPACRRLLATEAGHRPAVEVNGRTYAPPSRPTIAICLDGSEEEYLDKASAAGCTPNIDAILRRDGLRGMLQGAMPSYTNPNNTTIVTGVKSDQHGICGNYFYDQEAGVEVLMNSPDFLRASTILAAFAKSGTPVVTDKLLKILSHGAEDCPNFLGFSVEKAESPETAQALANAGVGDIAQLMSGAAVPDIYDPDISVYCLQAGLALLRSQEYETPPLMYLSTTDFVQHKWAPGDAEANEFYSKIDAVFGELDSEGAVVGLTADHGMNAKTNPDGTPKVHFLESVLSSQGIEARVILPITDPYVVHHGALGGYATVYLSETSQADAAAAVLSRLDGVQSVLSREEAAARFSLPPDRIGDLVVDADRGTVFGRTEEWHDLSHVPNLRSHGSTAETSVPFVVNRPLGSLAKNRVLEKDPALQYGNADLFHILLNEVPAEE